MTITKEMVATTVFTLTGCAVNPKFLTSNDYYKLGKHLISVHLGVIPDSEFRKRYLKEISVILLRENIIDKPLEVNFFNHPEVISIN